MNEPSIDRQTALAQIAERWDAERSERALMGVQLELRRRRVRRARTLASGGVASLLLAALAWVWGPWRAPVALPSALRRPAPARPADAQAATLAAQPLELADGSTILPRDVRSRVVVKEVSSAFTSVELASGTAHFEVTHREGRVFRVLCGEVSVEVLGTSFELERDGPRTRVSVLRGRVAVHWGNAKSELAAGEAGWFPKAVDEAPPPSVTVAEDDAPQPAQKLAARTLRGGGWREPAERGDFEHAYALLAQARRAPASAAAAVHMDDVEELMLAADTARLSGHPEAALPFLERVAEQHPKDARAALAAFTLGSVLLHQLGRPREAEAAYAHARALAPDSSLAQDALAREVEAAHRAGDADRARALASEYLARYPEGRRVHAVRRFGGLHGE